MGRTRKEGLNYFPADTTMFRDIKVRKLLRYRRDGGLTVYMYLLCSIYGQGYYMEYYDDLAFEIAEQTGLEESLVADVIDCCLTLGLLDRGMYEGCGVLTSAAIQRRYMKICRQCRRSADVSRYCLLASEASGDGGDRRPEDARAGNVISAEEKNISSEDIPAEKGADYPPAALCAPVGGSVTDRRAERMRISSEGKPITSETIHPKYIYKEETKVSSSPLTPQRGKPKEGREDVFLSSALSRRDGKPRNYDGLLLEMNRLHIPDAQQNVIIRLSNYGEIGHPVWPLISQCVASLGKNANDRDRIRMPGSFIVSKLKERLSMQMQA